MPRKGDDLRHWLTDKEQDEQLFKLGQDMDKVMDRLRTVETTLYYIYTEELIVMLLSFINQLN